MSPHVTLRPATSSMNTDNPLRICTKLTRSARNQTRLFGTIAAGRQCVTSSPSIFPFDPFRLQHKIAQDYSLWHEVIVSYPVAAFRGVELHPPKSRAYNRTVLFHVHTMTTIRTSTIRTCTDSNRLISWYSGPPVSNLASPAEMTSQVLMNGLPPPREILSRAVQGEE